jgi:uncharacterized protein (UPF0332 family)
VKPELQALINKAQKSLSASELLLREGYTDFAASRAYYAMFYAAEALLLERGQAFSSQKAVISAFGVEFARTAQMAPAHHRALIDAQNLRQTGDYESDTAVTNKEAKQTIEAAREFLQATIQKLAAT